MQSRRIVSSQSPNKERGQSVKNHFDCFSLSPQALPFKWSKTFKMVIILHFPIKHCEGFQPFERSQYYSFLSPCLGIKHPLYRDAKSCLFTVFLFSHFSQSPLWLNINRINKHFHTLSKSHYLIFLTNNRS